MGEPTTSRWQVVRRRAAELARRGATFLRAHLDLPLVVIAVLFAVPMLGYAHGRDQASFQYVAREWLHGSLPYRDVLDQKPPVIYVIHAIAILISGGSQWGIRLLDIAALVGMAFLLARALRRPVTPGTAGVLAILLTGFYCTAFDFWMSAQVEIWEALFLLAAWVAVETIQREDRRAAISGLLSSLALLTKLTAVLVSLVIAARLCWRAFGERRWRGVVRAVLVHGLAGAALVLAVILYWWLRGGLRDLWDVVIVFNRAYAKNWVRDWPTSWVWTKEWFARSLYYKVFLGLWIGGLVWAWRSKDRAGVRAFAWTAALLATSLASVVIQRKFFAYHWGVTVPFTVLVAGYCVARSVARFPLATAAAAVLVLALGFVWAPPWNVDPKLNYRNYTASFLAYHFGSRTRTQFLAHFNQRGHQYGNMEAVASKLREIAKPGETLCVEGYEPVFYVVSGLSCPHRFYSTNILTDPRANSPLTPGWHVEYGRAMKTHPPTYQVNQDQAVLKRRGCEIVFHDGIWWLGRCQPPRKP